MKHNIDSKNKKAFFKYEILESFCCGVVLQGTEIKSIRLSQFDFSDSYCFFQKNELYLKNFNISEYEFGTYNNHDPKRDRKLLLTKKELKRLADNMTVGGVTIIPLRIFINDKGFCKFDIGLVRGKKNYEKRNSILEKEEKIRINRDYKINI